MKNQLEKDEHGTGVKVLEEASQCDFSAYVFDQTKIFLRSSRSRDLDFLTYLLEMVAVEAARLRDET